jgi:16S rRNA (uracil1498-N3)-methyltransferase
VERGDPSGLAVFVTEDAPVAGATSVLGEEAAHHMRVRRLDVGTVVGLRDGAGHVATGTLVRLAKQAAHVEVTSVTTVPPPRPVHLLVPVADRDRMLWLAEKAAELACTSWRPVLWRRSRSVSPRGEGVTFLAKVQARMRSALGQSQGAWLPQLYPEATPDRAILAAPDGSRLMLDAGGVPMVGAGAPPLDGPITLAIGPEGGFEADEREALIAAGFVPVSLGGTILRFETAAVVALGIARAAG